MDCVGCGSAAVTERPDRTAQGYRRFRCRDCGKQFNERSDGVLTPITMFGSPATVASRSSGGASSISTSPRRSRLKATDESGVITHSTRSTFIGLPPAKPLAGSGRRI
jgi:hypothetical protein